MRLGHKTFLFKPFDGILHHSDFHQVVLLYTACFRKHLTVFGGNSEEGTPVPIPNTEVKLFSADGTAWDSAWESRTPPKFI